MDENSQSTVEAFQVLILTTIFHCQCLQVRDADVHHTSTVPPGESAVHGDGRRGSAAAVAPPGHMRGQPHIHCHRGGQTQQRGTFNMRDNVCGSLSMQAAVRLDILFSSRLIFVTM